MAASGFFPRVRPTLALAGAIWLGTTAGARASRPAGGPILVSAAASLTEVIREIAGAFERERGAQVDLNLGASSSLARQILEGAPVDVFISADEAQMNRVADAIGLLAGSRLNLLSNQLVVLVPADRDPGLRTLADLAGSRVRRIAIGDPAAVPAGVYARRHLERLGLWASLESRLVPTASVRAVLAVVESGNVDAGFVYRTDAAIARRSKVALAVPIPDGPSIVYPAAIVRDSRHPTLARQFLSYLQGPVARATFERAGFVVPGRSAATAGRGPG